MNYVNVSLSYKDEFKAYCVSDETVNRTTADGSTPCILFKDEDYAALGGTPSENKPCIGFLLGRETGYYSIDYNYAKAIVASGVNIRFLCYEKVAEQMENLCGLILPGGAFSSPDSFYADGQKLYERNKRYEAYETAIHTAEKQNMPVLGICGGAQMIAGLHNMQLCRNVHQNSSLLHKSKEAAAHKILIYPDTPLMKLLACQETIVNSRHNEAVTSGTSSDLQIYAIAEDNIPEAWGNEEKNILCIQWHPEDFAIQGNLQMQNIYNWLAQKAEAYRSTR